jgi:hypothetical protein
MVWQNVDTACLSRDIIRYLTHSSPLPLPSAIVAKNAKEKFFVVVEFHFFDLFSKPKRTKFHV